MSEHSEHAQATHTHGLLRNALLTLLILTVFFGPCYSSYSYSRVLTGHAYSRTHTHGPLSTALLMLTHTHSRPGEFSNPVADSNGQKDYFKTENSYTYSLSLQSSITNKLLQWQLQMIFETRVYLQIENYYYCTSFLIKYQSDFFPPRNDVEPDVFQPVEILLTRCWRAIVCSTTLSKNLLKATSFHSLL